ncbi:MAG: DUF5652 family protein [Minisyncoccota bacterium]
MHGFSPIYLPFALAFLPLLIVLAIWTIILKGFALWHAARGSQKWWFIALLIVNTLGILEIIYLIWFRPTLTDVTHSPSTPAHDSSAGA